MLGMLVFALHAGAQVGEKTDYEDMVVNRDSIWGIEFDFSELDPAKVNVKALRAKLARLKAYNDSMMLAVRARNIKERSDSLEQLYEIVASDTSSSYLAYSFFGGQYHSTFNNLNNALSSAGMPRLNRNGYHFTSLLDITWKNKRHMNDFYISNGSQQSATKADVSVNYSFLNIFNYRYGYCIVDRHRFCLFPLAGLHFQFSQLNFVNTSVPIRDFNESIYDTLLYAVSVNKKGIEYNFRRRDLSLSLGLETDVHLIYSKRKNGLILGLRATQMVPLASTGWVLDGKSYSQLRGVNINDYHFDIVLRVYTRMNPKGDRYLRNNWWAEYYY